MEEMRFGIMPQLETMELQESFFKACLLEIEYLELEYIII